MRRGFPGLRRKYAKEGFMIYSIENDVLEAKIDSLGAQLLSVTDKATKHNYLWGADPAYWGKTAPILFPFIGKLEGAGYTFNEARYAIEKHGFARDMQFAIVQEGLASKDATDGQVTAANEEAATPSKVTLGIASAGMAGKYPFPFTLQITYALQDRKLFMKIEIANAGTEAMYFSFGGHPAFAAGPDRRAYRVKLYGAEDKAVVTSTDIGVPDGLLTGGSTKIALANGSFPIVSGIFDQDALCFVAEGITAIGLIDETGKEQVRVQADCPVWGVWSMPTDEAAYVCFEPWWGICDAKGYAGTLQERPFTQTLAGGEIWRKVVDMSFY